MRYSEVFRELLRIRDVHQFSVNIAKVFAAFWVMRLPHLGHASAAFGSCIWRIWVMRLPHLGHVAGVAHRRLDSLNLVALQY